MEAKEALQLFAEIDNEGLGYWVQNYGYHGRDKELKSLCREVQKAMDALDGYIQNIFEKHDIG